MQFLQGNSVNTRLPLKSIRWVLNDCDQRRFLSLEAALSTGRARAGMSGLTGARMQSGDWPGPLAGEGSSGCDLLLQPSTRWSFSLSFAPYVMTHWQNNTRRFGSFHTIMGRFAHPGCTGLKRFPDLACKVGGGQRQGQDGEGEAPSLSLHLSGLTAPSSHPAGARTPP